MISEKQRSRVEGYIAKGIEEGRGWCAAAADRRGWTAATLCSRRYSPMSTTR
ncbi:aldehyde dehydrogenase domain protein [Mycobacterium xenopi 3993]|nr:aldehyde dehydrogenase domain protein [Mycobacterium xenopi 3993]